ncbi:type II toxin-antitoxin system RelE/ParE family toxin [Oleomonas cavernae]|uniref:Type II toxin-antitoxin system RelE/ParE family toxin n=1 Tax=Oleomonas cavernae TaxID=2320859 RepID=A0A418WJD2_9PROT|nr:type II toxin-antitoxin system RelE/ParE family toxin [Oleomonas cavernae]RJF90042.1 type II toxin-antitoxin system RelE/ParE family toxin [Oleomonas cavernae]
MKVYKTRWMARFLRRERLGDGRLREAINQAERGLVDADLGGGLVKLRVARTGKGKSGGYRMLVAYRRGDRAVFLYGFAKNERENIEPHELLTLREIGAVWLAASPESIAQAVKDKALEEVADDENGPS